MNKMIQEFVSLSETDFEIRLASAARKIGNGQDIKIVTIAGPSCAGKTTTANKLISILSGEYGRRVYRISIDDYYYDRNDNDDGIPDYDSIRAIDFELLSININEIIQGDTLDIPVYDFVTGKRSGYRKLDSADYDIFIFEGIQAMYPQVLDLLDDNGHMSIFINVTSDVEVGGVSYDRREIRLFRRLVRDYRFRGANADRTFFLWDNSVVPNEEKNIIPNIKNTKIKINSYMAYELFVLRDPLVAVLSEMSPDSEYYSRGQAILEKILPLEDIGEEYIPENSLYREFLG